MTENNEAHENSTREPDMVVDGVEYYKLSDEQLKIIKSANVNSSNGLFPKGGELFTHKADKGTQRGVIQMPFLEGMYASEVIVELFKKLDDIMPGLSKALGQALWTSGIRVKSRPVFGEVGYIAYIKDMETLARVWGDDLMKSFTDCNVERDALETARQELAEIANLEGYIKNQIEQAKELGTEPINLLYGACMNKTGVFQVEKLEMLRSALDCVENGGDFIKNLLTERQEAVDAANQRLQDKIAKKVDNEKKK